MNAGGGFVAGSIVAKLLMDKTGWNASVAAIKADKGSLSSITAGIGAGFVRLGQVAALAGLAAAGALAVMVKKTAAAGDELFEMSQKTGISVELLSAYKLEAEKAGSSLEGLAIGIRFLSRNIFDAGRGIKLTQQYFDQLGISTEGWKNKLPDVNEVLLKIADRFAGMADGAEKSALAIKVLGRSGTELIPFLNVGSEGLREAAELAKKLGVVFTKETAAAAHELSHTLKDLGAGFQGFRNTIANALVPVANELGRHFVDALILLQGKIKEFADSGALKEWAIGTAKAFIVAAKIMVQAIELVAIAIPSIKAGIGEAWAAIEDVVAGANDVVAKMLRVTNNAAAAGYAAMAEQAREMAAELRKTAGEQTDAAAKIAEPFEIAIRTLEELAASFGKAVPLAKKAAAEIKTAFDSLALKNKLSLTFTSDIAEKIADITLALKVFKDQLTPEAERKLRDELEALGEKFGFLKEKLGITFSSDVKKKIDDITKAMEEFQGRMDPETARRLAEELRHLGDDTDYLRTELGLTFTEDVTRRIDDIQAALRKYKDRLSPEAERKLREELRGLVDQFNFLKEAVGATFTSDVNRKIDDITLALEKYKGLLTPESERKLREELALLSDEFGFLKTELGLTFTSDLDRQIEDIALALEKFRGQLTADASKELKDRLLDLQLSRLGVTKNIVDALNGAYGEMASGLADTFEGMLNGTKKFGDAFVAIWQSIKKAFFRILGEMVAEFIVKFIKQIIAGMSLIKALESALGIGRTLAKAAVGVVGGIAATGAAAAGTGTIITNTGAILGTEAATQVGAAFAGTINTAVAGGITAGMSSTAVLGAIGFAAVWLGTLFGRLFGKSAADKWNDAFAAKMKEKYGENWKSFMTSTVSVGSLRGPATPLYGALPASGALRTATGSAHRAGTAGETTINFTIHAMDGADVNRVVRTKIIPILRKASTRGNFLIPVGGTGGP